MHSFSSGDGRHAESVAAGVARYWTALRSLWRLERSRPPRGVLLAIGAHPAPRAPRDFLRHKRYRVPALFSMVAALVGCPTALLADDVHCPPDLGSVTIDGNVLVAAACRLDGTTVNGNVHLYAGGSLIARGRTRIGGSIQAENADFIDVADAQVNGNIQLDNMVGDRSIIARSTVGGSIQLKSNRSRLEVLGNTVNADVQAFSNIGGVIVADNVIDGNLQCKSNDPPPGGGNNRVQGNKEDQCADLAAEAGPTPSTGAAEAPAEASGGGGSFGLSASVLLLGLWFAQLATRPRRVRYPYAARADRLSHRDHGPSSVVLPYVLWMRHR